MKKYRLTNIQHLLATGFGSGLIQPAPGTWGTLCGLLLGIALNAILPWWAFLALIVLAFYFGCGLCSRVSEEIGIHDDGRIVFDEMVAIWLVLLCLPEQSVAFYITAFVTFRLFDILKPAPIRFFDASLKSGFGIMFDDLLAAGYTILTLYLIAWLA